MVKRKRQLGAKDSSSRLENEKATTSPVLRHGRRGGNPFKPETVDLVSLSDSNIIDSRNALKSGRDSKSAVEVNKVPEKIEGQRKANKDSTTESQLDGASARIKRDEDMDREADSLEDAGEEELIDAFSRTPPVNSSYLPLPWKGRLGYACLNTYLRSSNPPVFSSRTCRIESILKNRHPLKDQSQPPHPTKNPPDENQSPDVALGQAFVESLGLANARDIVKMIRWNDKYGIKFLRLSSEMFPFASHEAYGYKLAPFASKELAEAGRVAAELGHRLTTHPGQYTQLGSPRKEVIQSSIRDLEYHAEMLSLLKLPPQQDRDAVMILHMGGVFKDKAATLDRFRDNYLRLSQDVKERLVLENDDVSWSVHDLLPICEELNIPLVLDYHHHNIVFDADKMREGTLDIMNVYDRIKATWTRKGITQKMHYSEPTPGEITNRQRRKHSSRVTTLPPCDPNMDLMIEAKDKEQAVFELMRVFKLPGFDLFNDMIPHQRSDENKPIKVSRKRKQKKDSEDDNEGDSLPNENAIPDTEIGMGGPDRRVYWPPGMEDWLRPKKRLVTSKVGIPNNRSHAATPKQSGANGKTKTKIGSQGTRASSKASSSGVKKLNPRSVPTPSPSDNEDEIDFNEDDASSVRGPAMRRSRSTRQKKQKINYAEEESEDE